MKMTSIPKDIPKLDLYNFEESQYERCDYVLTSPRSLEACSRLDVMPTDLLSKSLVEFHEELREYDLRPSTIFFLYNEQENERQKNLAKCREERSRIIKAEQMGLRRLTTEEEEPFCKNPIELSNIPDINYKTEDYRHGPVVRKPRSRSACSQLEDRRRSKDLFNESVRTIREMSMKLRLELMARKRNQFRDRKNLSETPVDVSLSPRATSEPTSITREKSTISVEKNDALECRGYRRPKLSPKDQKILDIMKSKMEEERALIVRREKLHLAWDDEQKREEAAKMAMENIRRNRLAAENLLRKQEQEYWENEKKKLNQMEILQKEMAIERGSEHRAKLLAEQQEKKNLKQTNSERLEKFKVQKETLNMQSRASLESMMASLERQHAQAKDNYEKLMEQREKEHQLKRKELEMRLEQNRKVRNQLKEEMLNCQRIYSQAKHKERKHVSSAAAKLANIKAKKTRDERLSREKCQIANMRKINMCLELWKRKTEENIQGKLKKCEEMQAAKNFQLSQNRASAIESQKMRRQLSDLYDRNNFDKKLLEAHLYANMGNGVQTASKNLSSLSLG